MSDFLDAMRTYPDLLRVCGVLGSMLYICGFALVQTGRICGNGPIYSCNQLTAASLVLCSLVGAFNLGAFLIQVGFLTFGTIGLARRLRLRRMRQYPNGTGVIRSLSNAPRALGLQGDWPMISDWEMRQRAPANDTQAPPYLGDAAPAP